MYYIADNNNVIKLYNSDKQILIDTLAAMPQYADIPIQQTDRNIMLLNGTFVFEDEHQEEILEQAQIIKKAENQQKLDEARTSHTFTVTLQNQECEFDTKDKTQSDLNSAAIASGMGQPWLWTTNNRITLSLTAEDIQIVSAAYMQEVNADIAKWTDFEEQIENATSAEDVENIEIVY